MEGKKLLIKQKINFVINFDFQLLKTYFFQLEDSNLVHELRLK